MDKVHYYSTPHQAISLIEADYKKFAFRRHYHLDFHIGLITGGQQKFAHRGEQHLVGPGEVVIMPPDELHDGRSLLDSGYQVRVFSVTPEWFSEYFELSSPENIIRFKHLIVSDSAIFSQLNHFHKVLTQTHLSQLAKDCLPYEGFNSLLSRYGVHKPQPMIPLGKQTIETLKAFLLAHLDQPIRLEQLAQLCQLSPTQFQRHFKAQMGITPYAWFSRLRLEQAMKLLQRGMCGTEVALQVGFYDQAHFTKAFKLTYGVSPSAIN
ncbi:AraC family transcriptional regulator [Vibrio cincinnatiensis]|uniref:AraC family transcriptional regulator n=1 Tax=Vibrio cincinnatiensis TaxID=675 RepID=UPI001EE027D9|nr:AraC family transcriptional regulator [Vibrio cincinnatiensis]MCG3767059.1 AraC family transcriptional regulator [Vibrio cincinnatiensis]